MGRLAIPRMHLIASSDELRPGLCCVAIDGDWTVATDSRMLLAVHTEAYPSGVLFENKEGVKLIDKRVWEFLYNKASVIRFGDEAVQATVGFQQLDFLYVDESFPNWRQALTGSPNSVTSLGMNPDMFYNLKRALLPITKGQYNASGFYNPTITFTGEHTPSYMTVGTEERIIAVAMPSEEAYPFDPRTVKEAKDG